MFVVSVELVRDATRRVGSHRGSAGDGGQALWEHVQAYVLQG